MDVCIISPFCVIAPSYLRISCSFDVHTYVRDAALSKPVLHCQDVICSDSTCTKDGVGAILWQSGYARTVSTLLFTVTDCIYPEAKGFSTHAHHTHTHTHAAHTHHTHHAYTHAYTHTHTHGCAHMHACTQTYSTCPHSYVYLYLHSMSTMHSCVSLCEYHIVYAVHTNRLLTNCHTGTIVCITGYCEI